MSALTQIARRRREQVRPTEAVVDLDAVRHNARETRRVLVEAARAEGRAPPPQLLAVVKADAYGHGAVPVALALESVAADAGLAWLGVALVEEGRALREAGVTLPILVLGGAYDGEGYRQLVTHRLTPVVFRRDHLDGLREVVPPGDAPFGVHLKIDTGMGRLGAMESELPEVLEAFAGCEALRIDGLMTHFANADLVDEPVTREQMTRFDAAMARIREAGHAPRWVHLANSAAVLAWGEELTAHTLVRPGLMLYGYSPSDGLGSRVSLRPALTWRTRISHLKRVPAGTKVSYGQTWTAPRESLIAVLPVGYADGYDRRHSDGSPVLVRGRRCHIVGRVCMDLCMADVTDVGGVEIGDEVVLLGGQGDERVPADELARRIGTIPYEVLCGIDSRVPRAYR